MAGMRALPTFRAAQALAISGLVAFGGATGCGGGGGGQGFIQVSWQIQDQVSGHILSCTTNEIVVVTVATVPYQFPCAVGSGTTPAIPAGTYDVKFELKDTSTNPPATESMQFLQVTVLAGQTAVVTLPPFAVAGSGGQISLAWQIQDSQTGAQVLCNPGEQVVVSAGNTGTSFDCNANMGVTNSIPPGTYSVRFQLVQGTTVEVEPLPQTLTVAPGQVTTLTQPVIFTVEAGTAQFNWNLLHNGAPAGCGVGEQVTFDFGGAVVYPFSCGNTSDTMGTGTTGPIVRGTYNVTASISSGDSHMLQVTIPSAATAVYNVTFNVP